MTPSEKHTLEDFATGTGAPYVELLRRYRKLSKHERWKALAYMRRVDEKWKAHVAAKRAGVFKRAAATLRTLVLGVVARR